MSQPAPPRNEGRDMAAMRFEQRIGRAVLSPGRMRDHRMVASASSASVTLVVVSLGPTMN